MKFTNFKEAQPPQGMVTWRTEEGEIPYLFNAKMRMRGAGFEDVLSPSFDYWDGYKVHVQYNVEWSDELVEIKKDQIIPEYEISACPFCNNKPIVIWGGGYVCAPPMKAKYFHLSCCQFIASSSNTYTNLKKLLDDWNNALKK